MRRKWLCLWGCWLIRRESYWNKSLLDGHCSDLSITFYTSCWGIYFGISFFFVCMFSFAMLFFFFFQIWFPWCVRWCQIIYKGSTSVFSEPSPSVLTKAKWSSIADLGKPADMTGQNTVCNKIVPEEGCAEGYCFICSQRSLGQVTYIQVLLSFLCS